MSRKYRFGDFADLYFVSYATVGWIDLFTRNDYRQIVADSLNYCIRHKGLIISAWCLMTNHVHLIMSTDGRNRPEAILRDHKRHTSEQLRAAILNHPGESRREWMMREFVAAGTANSNNRGFQLWQQDNHPIHLYSREVMYQKPDYTHRNPQTAGFVTEPEGWAWSSARDYAGMEGYIQPLMIIERFG